MTPQKSRTIGNNWLGIISFLDDRSHVKMEKKNWIKFGIKFIVFKVRNYKDIKVWGQK